VTPGAPSARWRDEVRESVKARSVATFNRMAANQLPPGWNRRAGWPRANDWAARTVARPGQGLRRPTQAGSVSRTLTAPPPPPERDPRLTRIEAVLLLAREPLSSRKLAQFAGLADGTEARTLVRRLNARYDREGRAIRVEELAGGFQLLTRAAFAPWLRKLHRAPVEVRLSAPALETLAVVAYRQPVPRAEIEAVRGVQCGEMLRQLLERDLARIVGRSGELGRPFLYGTTRRFLQIFGLRDLEDLPRADRLRKAAPPVGAEAGSHHNERPAERLARSIVSPQDRLEESAVKTAFPLELDSEEWLGRPSGTAHDVDPSRRTAAERAQVEDEDDDLDDEDEEDDDDEEDEEEDDLEEDEWEEVDDDDEEEDEDDEEDDDDWDDEDDDDWDDDEDEDEDEEADDEE